MAANKDLQVTITIVHKGEMLAEDTIQLNDDLLQYLREREFGLEHQTATLSLTVIKKALANYDAQQ